MIAASMQAKNNFWKTATQLGNNFYQLYVSAQQILLRMSQTLAFAKLASHKLISVALLVRLALVFNINKLEVGY